jgi:hypothetical protein
VDDVSLREEGEEAAVFRRYMNTYTHSINITEKQGIFKGSQETAYGMADCYNLQIKDF